MVRSNLLSPRPWLLLLILLAFALRIHKLETQSLWYDEGVSATVGQYDLAQLTQWTANDIQPPLYYYVLAGWGRLTDWREWNLRFPSLWFGVLTVPLLAMLTHSLSRNRWAALLVALFTSLHPLLIYYSQEARMYSMLVALCVLMGYALVRLGDTGKDPRYRAATRLWWIIFVLAATAAAYTHYFAFFLLFALLFAFTLESFTPRTTHHAPRKTQLAIAILAILLLYSPWFFALFTRLAVDASYWQGEFKWWEALRQTFSSFALGETMLAQDVGHWLPIFAVALGWAIFRLLWDRHWRALWYGAIWVLIPLGGILVLAWINPKFNPRYMMVALPGLIVLLSVGLAGNVEHERSEIGRLRDWLRQTTASMLNLLIALLILLAFTTSTRNWFNNSAFSKAQWREAATYIAQHIQPTEKVVLVSGHAWPVWNYYAATLVPVRLPEIEILDVNAVLGYETVTTALRTQLGAATGVWLLNWQDEVVDPNAMAALALEINGNEQPVDAQFWQLRLRHFTAINSSQISSVLPIGARVDADFGQQLRLLGYQQLANDDLLLTWQRASNLFAPTADLLITGNVTTHDRIYYTRLHERRPASYTFPVARWRADEIVIGRIPIVDLVGPGGLPGSYQLALTLFDPAGDPAGLDVRDRQGRTLGKQLFVSLEVNQIVPGIRLNNDMRWQQLDAGRFVTGTLSAHDVESGTPVILDLQWYVQDEQPARPFGVIVDGKEEWYEMLPEDFKDLQLPAQQILHQKIRLPRLPVGSLSVQITVPDTNDYPPVIIGNLLVRPSLRTLSLLNLAQSFNTGFYLQPESGSQGDLPIVTLAGTKEQVPTTLTIGSSLDLNLVWQAGAALVESTGAESTGTGSMPTYHLSLQWLDSAGALVDQVDAQLPENTATWRAAQVFEHLISIKAPTLPGTYQLIIAVYDPDTTGLPRLWSAQGQDYAKLGEIRVVP